MTFISSTAREEVFSSPHDGSRQTYLLADFRSASKAAATLLVVYLHGAGSHQEQGMTPEIYGNAFGRMGQWMSQRDAIYICPEYRGNSWMSPAAEDDVRELIRIASAQYRPHKTLLVGGSMGGTGALIFASRNPGIADAVLAFCPATDIAAMYPKFAGQLAAAYGGSPEEVPEAYRERSVCTKTMNLALPRLAIIHGTDDATMPVDDVRELVSTLRAGHAPVRYSEIKNGNHDAPLFFDFLPQLDWLVAEEAAATCVTA